VTTILSLHRHLMTTILSLHRHFRMGVITSKFVIGMIYFNPLEDLVVYLFFWHSWYIYMCRRSSDDDFMFASSFSNVIRITIFEHLKGFVAYYFFLRKYDQTISASSFSKGCQKNRTHRVKTFPKIGHIGVKTFPKIGHIGVKTFPKIFVYRNSF